MDQSGLRWIIAELAWIDHKSGVRQVKSNPAHLVIWLIFQ